VVIEHLQHNKLTLPRLCPEFFRSEYGISAIELGLTDTDVVAAGDNLSELARDKRFPIFNNKVKRMLDVSLEEGIEILRRIGAEYIYLPHPTFIAGAAKNGYKNLLSKVDAIEVFNATTSWFPPYNKRALLLAEQLQKTKTAGVDGHFGEEAFFSCHNEIPASSKEEIYEAMRKGRVQPYVSPMHPFRLLREYTVLTYLVAKDISKSKLKISLSDITSLAKQPYLA